MTPCSKIPFSSNEKTQHPDKLFSRCQQHQLDKKVQLILPQLISVIQEILKVHAIYVIGYRKHIKKGFSCLQPDYQVAHNTSVLYTLVIISHQQVEDPQKFMQIVSSRLQHTAQIFAIHYTYNELRFRLDEGTNFLGRIMSNAVLLYRENEELLNYPYHVCYHPSIFREIQSVWQLRLNCAKCFLEKATITGRYWDQYSQYLLFQEVVRQICIGLLYVFWEYRANQFSIPFLLNLCDQFCELPELIYPKNRFRSQDAYHKLCHARYLLDYQLDLKPSTVETGYIEKAVRKFLNKAELTAADQLKILEQIHHKNEKI